MVYMTEQCSGPFLHVVLNKTVELIVTIARKSNFKKQIEDNRERLR